MQCKCGTLDFCWQNQKAFSGRELKESQKKEQHTESVRVYFECFSIGGNSNPKLKIQNLKLYLHYYCVK